MHICYLCRQQIQFKQILVVLYRSWYSSTMLVGTSFFFLVIFHLFYFLAKHFQDIECLESVSKSLKTFQKVSKCFGVSQNVLKGFETILMWSPTNNVGYIFDCPPFSQKLPKSPSPRILLIIMDGGKCAFSQHHSLSCYVETRSFESSFGKVKRQIKFQFADNISNATNITKSNRVECKIYSGLALDYINRQHMFICTHWRHQP